MNKADAKEEIKCEAEETQYKAKNAFEKVYTSTIIFLKAAIRLFTAKQLQRVSICCLKGQHPLTKF